MPDRSRSIRFTPKRYARTGENAYVRVLDGQSVALRGARATRVIRPGRAACAAGPVEDHGAWIVNLGGGRVPTDSRFRQTASITPAAVTAAPRASACADQYAASSRPRAEVALW